MITDEIAEIKQIILSKKAKFKKSHSNFKELNDLLGRSETTRPNLMLELTAHEIISDSKFLEIISNIFAYDLNELITTINADFQSTKTPLSIKDKSIENFNEVKENLLGYLKTIKTYYEKKFGNIKNVIDKQDVDIDDMVNEFHIVEKMTKDKLDVNEMAFKKLEKKYLDILVYIKEKISN